PLRDWTAASEAAEPLALFDEPLQQRCRLPLCAAEALVIALDGLQDLVEANLVGPEHRSTPIDREAVAVNPDHVDIRRALSDAFLEDLGALVDHHVHAALEDFLLADLARGDALLLTELLDQAIDLGVGDGRAAAFLVAVDTGVGLLPQTTLLGELVQPAGRHVPAGLAPLLPNPVADVDAGQVRHGKLAHGDAEIGQHLVDLGRRGPLVDQGDRLGATLVQHAIADEAIAVANQHADLADAFGQIHDRGDDFIGSLRAAHVLQQLHDVGGAEEVHADHVLRPLGGRGDLVDAERGGVGGEDSARLADLVQPGEDLLLELHILEHRLNHQVDLLEVVVGQRRPDQAHALLDLLHGDATALGGVLVVAAHHGQTTIQGFLADIHDVDRDASIGEVHGDAAAHGAGADDRRRLDLTPGRILVDPRHASHFALGEEHVALRLGLGRVDQL